LSLSRQHRHLLLLVDGQRTVADMVRLIGRAQNEVQKLLGDLEQAGIIQSYR
jgi:predicted transcriptional regulator